MSGKRQRALMSKRWWYASLAVAVLLSMRTLLWTPAHAQSDPTSTPNVNWVRQPLGVNVRSGPGLQYGPIGALAVGTWVQPLARDPSDEWVLIAYLDTQGWVRADGVSWRLDTAALPVMDRPSPTAIPRPLYYNTPGGPTYTPNANWVNVGAVVAFVRSGPGRGYLSLGQLATGDVVDPVAHDAALDWVLVRYGDGYGWVRYDLVAWATDVAPLPVVDVPNLTPSFTPVPILPTATRTYTPSATPTASDTATVTPTVTPSATFTLTLTASATSTATATPSATWTATPSATNSETPSATPTATFTASATFTPTLTASPQPTETHSPTPSPSVTATDVPSATASALPSLTAPPSVTPTALPSATLTPSPSATPQAVAALSTAPPAEGAAPATTPPDAAQSTFPVPYWVVGGLVSLLALLYAGVYMQQWARLARYREGFVIAVCPVCGQGHLHMEERRYRLLGIPRVRRVVRCDVCRSVLREVGEHRWRYAVDGAENPTLYETLNGRVLSEAELLRIAPEYEAMQYVEDEEL